MLTQLIFLFCSLSGQAVNMKYFYLLNGKLNTLIFSWLVIVIILLPQTSQAASVYSQAPTNHFAVQDKKVVYVKLDTGGQTINTLEGLVGVFSPDGPVYIRELNVGGSDFSLWPNKPSLSTDNGHASISFVGGVPGGINKPDALVFTIALTVENPGLVYIVPASIVGYVNDGKGTPVAVSGHELQLSVSPVERTPVDEWAGMVSDDTEPPRPFVINMGRDAALYDGKWFISFFSTDSGSGIDHYEVQEGKGKAVRSGMTYVLQNQNRKESITVTAFDKAGNKRVAIWSPSFLSVQLFDKIIIGISLLLLGVVFCIVIFKWHKQKRKKI